MMSGSNQDKSDRELFEAAVGDARRLPQDKVSLRQPRKKRTSIPADPASPVEVETALPLENSRARSVAMSSTRGISRADLRKLKSGQVQPSRRLDLHGYRSDGAALLLRRHIATARVDGIRCLVVIHGKGHHSDAGVSVLQQRVRETLNEHPDVIAYCPATPRDGGSGATYAYLKKATPRIRPA